ncbi:MULTISPECIES: 50S ribosomal protein L3 [Acidianus]|uniref:Large ribosomal subunit protein uL3 n=1 Tax=Candidatus Acidianus copahuensis TaxID=1160895 RepID=A0A031LKK0_9CREN|nr:MULTISPECIES: 50S ribosomal protein L3 [Acidianus]EZQ03863.1 50S ribosomal protein L3 [Candidatus Acidianus copahuensis]NON62163.1 50S ribosomal protein L3 [Acidianus sp. RZ1]
MGHRKLSSPRRGTAGLRPRKRASGILFSPRTWPILATQSPTLLGFIGYKVGMTHIYYIDDLKGSLNYGKEIFSPVTVIETPPIVPLALRAYVLGDNGEPEVLTDYWVEPPKEINITRRLKNLKVNKDKMSTFLEKIKSKSNEILYFRTIVATQPKLISSLGKKSPDIAEIQIGGGNVNSQLEYALNVLGKPLQVEALFKPGGLVDIIGVTKGHGFEGVVKRYEVIELPRWHKHRKGSRKAGTKGPSFATPSYVPQPGQMGFHRRTEHNKRILKISSNSSEINPAGGFVGYGLVKNTYMLIQGSTIGHKKRPLFLRYPIRPYQVTPEPPKITYVDVLSKQG